MAQRKTFRFLVGLGSRPPHPWRQSAEQPNPPGGHRASQALRLAASSLMNSQTALWGPSSAACDLAKGTPKALTATAHKLARLVYRMLKFGRAYVEQGEQQYEQKYRASVLKNLPKRAAALGYRLVENTAVNYAVSEKWSVVSCQPRVFQSGVCSPESPFH